MQIKWHWLPLNSSSDNALHLPQVQLSLESGHTQATSHCKESNLIPSSSFQSGIWNVWGRHKGCSCGLMHTTRGTVSMSTDWVGILGILDFLEVGGGFLWLPGWYHSTIGRHQGCNDNETDLLLADNVAIIVAQSSEDIQLPNWSFSDAKWYT